MMEQGGSKQGRYEGLTGRDHDALARWERREARISLRALSAEESCAELAGLFATFGTRPPADLLLLMERDERERLALIARRQMAFRALSVTAARGGTGTP